MTKDDFFQQVDASEIIEENIDRVVALEMYEAKKLSVIYKKALSDLVLKINTASSGSFSEAKMKVALEQVKASLKVIEAQSLKRVRNSSKLMVRQSVGDSIHELNSLEKRFKGVWTQIPFDAVELSLDKNTYLFNSYISSLNSYNQSLRSSMESRLSSSIVKRESYTQAAMSLGVDLGGFEEWKIARIGRTELYGVYNKSKMVSFGKIRDKFVPGLKKTVVIPMDGRTSEDSKYLKKLNLIIPIEEDFVYEWKDQKRRFTAPPDRPNDRSILVPVDESWIKST